MSVDFAAAERELWWAISSHDFSKRQLRLAKFILKQSIGRSRGKAYVQSLEVFDEYTGLGISHVSEVLSFLKAALVICERPDHCYGFRFPIDAWKVPRLRERMYYDEQLDLIEVPPDLTDSLREVFVEQCNLPTRGLDRPVRPDRSDPGFASQDEKGGVVSRESAGSVPDHQAATAPAKVAPSPAPTSSGTEPPGKPFPESGNGPPRELSRIGNFPESGNDFPNRETVKIAVAAADLDAFPDSGNVSLKIRVQSAEVQSSETAELLTLKKALTAAQRALRERVRRAMASPEDAKELVWANWGGAWTNMIKRNATLVERVLADFECQVREGRKIPNPGGYMWDLVRRWRKSR